MAFSLKMELRRFAYAAKSAIFCYTCEHAHTGTRPRALLDRRAVAQTCESTLVGLLPSLV